jgi:hypothetical protein
VKKKGLIALVLLLLFLPASAHALDAYLAWDCVTCSTEKVIGFHVWKKAAGVTTWSQIFKIEDGAVRQTPAKITLVDKTTYGVTAYDASLNESPYAQLLYEVKAVKSPTNLKIMIIVE